jgi:hypothetical protein
MKVVERDHVRTNTKRDTDSRMGGRTGETEEMKKKRATWLAIGWMGGREYDEEG